MYSMMVFPIDLQVFVVAFIQAVTHLHEVRHDSGQQRRQNARKKPESAVLLWLMGEVGVLVLEQEQPILKEE